MSDDSYTPKGIQVYQGTHRPPTDPHRTGAEIGGTACRVMAHGSGLLTGCLTWRPGGTPQRPSGNAPRSLEVLPNRGMTASSTWTAGTPRGQRQVTVIHRLEQHGKFGLCMSKPGVTDLTCWGRAVITARNTRLHRSESPVRRGSRTLAGKACFHPPQARLRNLRGSRIRQ